MLLYAAYLLLGSSVAAASSLMFAPPGFDNATIQKVHDNMLEIATHSWELGTAAEALTELDAPSLSVFRASGLFPHLDNSVNASEVIGIATSVVRNKPADSLVLIDGNGAVGDPASLGAAVLLTNWTRTNISDTSFATAATEELVYLLTVAPRNVDGAISHRTDQVQLWADFVYMAPPFIAYYGGLHGGGIGYFLLQAAYNQCRLYRDNLRDAAAGLWRHIVLGSWQDNTHWGTGNAWAAAGMLRVLQTIRHSELSSQFVDEQTDLTAWIQEIISSAWQFQGANGTLFNVLDDPTTFADSSSTALLAAVTYRMAAITDDATLIGAANKALELIQNSVNPQGWLLNTVNPETFNTSSPAGTYSPEGQAFVLLLQAAWRDYVSFTNGELQP